MPKQTNRRIEHELKLKKWYLKSLQYMICASW